MMPRLPVNRPRCGVAMMSPAGVTRFCSGIGKLDVQLFASLRANGSRECAPDDRLREAIQIQVLGELDCFVANAPRNDGWITPRRRGSAAGTRARYPMER